MLSSFYSVECHTKVTPFALLSKATFLFIYLPLQSMSADAWCVGTFYAIDDNSTAGLPATAFFGAKVAPHGYSQGQAE